MLHIVYAMVMEHRYQRYQRYHKLEIRHLGTPTAIEFQPQSDALINFMADSD